MITSSLDSLKGERHKANTYKPDAEKKQAKLLVPYSTCGCLEDNYGGPQEANQTKINKNYNIFIRPTNIPQCACFQVVQKIWTW